MKCFITGLSILVVHALLTHCRSEPQKIAGKYNSGYNLEKPEARYLLPSELSEISGISILKGKIYCIQDESADIFIFDPFQNKVVTRYRNGIKGDFEDIVVIGTHAYILKSNGTIIMINNFAGTDKRLVEFDTPLSSENDTEGLAFDSETNSLLIACRGIGDKDVKKIYKGVRSFYRFSLEKKNMIPEPYFSIDLEDPGNFISGDIFEKLRILKSDKPGIKDFRPSALAYHMSGDLYVISSTGRLLVSLDKALKIKSFNYLSPEIFTQPEGITFSETGDMYISNEGRNGPGYILMFRAPEK